MPKYTTYICLSGHHPELGENDKYCKKCGELIISKCPECDNDFDNHPSEDIFCRFCSNPMPWTKKKIVSLNDIINNSSNITETEKKDFAKNIIDYLSENQRSYLAGHLIKNIISKLEPELSNIFVMTLDD